MTSFRPDLEDLLTVQAAFLEGKNETATFEITPTAYPPHWSFFVSAGLPDLLRLLEKIRPTEEDLAFLRAHDRFHDTFLSFLGSLDFTGELNAVPEGDLFFCNEAVVQITAPFLEGCLVLSGLRGLLSRACLVATQAARCVLAARGRPLFDGNLGKSGLPSDSRFGAIGGLNATSSLEAGRRFGLPTASFVSDLGLAAEENPIEAYRRWTTEDLCGGFLPLDRADPVASARLAARVGEEMRGRGESLSGVHFSSSNPEALGKPIREILDAAGLSGTKILVAGPLDEFSIESALEGGAPIDGFVLTEPLGASAEGSTGGFTGSLAEIGGRLVPRVGPFGSVVALGAQKVYRIGDAQARPRHDILTLRDDAMESYGPKARPLLESVPRNTWLERMHQLGVQSPRERREKAVRTLRQDVRRIRSPETYEVRSSPSLLRLLKGD